MQLTTVQPGDEYTVTEEHTFVAQWEKNEGPVPVDDTPDPDNGDKPPKKVGITATGDNSQLEYFVFMILAIAMMGYMVFRRQQEMAFPGEVDQNIAGLPRATTPEPEQLSDSLSFRWLR